MSLQNKSFLLSQRFIELKYEVGILKEKGTPIKEIAELKKISVSYVNELLK